MTISSDSNEAKKIILSKKLLIFDFDGVLADSVKVKNSAFEELYREYAPEILEDVIAHLKINSGLSRFDKFKYYHKNFLNKEIDEDTLHLLSESFSKIVVANVIASPEIKNSVRFLEQYCNKGKISVINSATPSDEIKMILKERGISKFFDEIYGSPDSKTMNLKKIQKSSGVNFSDSLFFGDSRSDFFAAESVGMEFIGIGKEISSLLQNIQGDWFVFDDFTNLLV